MKTVYAINGSPRLERSNTAMLLAPFLQGMKDAGATFELCYSSQLLVKPCSCGRLYCWNDKPGECCLHDEMQSLYPKLKQAEILVLATPVYIPLPGDFQNIINRLVALMDPVLEFRGGRTRIRLREDVQIQQIVLVATSGWWELENLDTVVRIVEEIAKDASVEFAGALLRPHFSVMKQQGEVTLDGARVLNASHQAGYDLVKEGRIAQETLEAIRRPLISLEDFMSSEEDG